MPFHDFSKTLVTWKTHILAYFRLPIPMQGQKVQTIRLRTLKEGLMATGIENDLG